MIGLRMPIDFYVVPRERWRAVVGPNGVEGVRGVCPGCGLTAGLELEGVQADGTRTVMTIPAGQIGNERPIEIVSERWYSPELETVVMTKPPDPRMGETVYRLANINRAEPAHALFEVPADYTVK